MNKMCKKANTVCKKDVETMKKKYMIGLFAVIFIFSVLLTAGYQISYDHVTRQQAALDHEVTDTRSITAEGAAVEENGEDSEEGYYLCEMQGFVTVYLSDRQTIYELTEIPLSDLPEEVQQEIAAGKYIPTQEELYGFLENYSS